MDIVEFKGSAITSETELREIIGSPHKLVANKSISILDHQCRKFISMSSLLFLSTSNIEGKCDVSPRGDQPSSIKILNDHQLVIPDRPGNRRLDSILNILSNPHVGILFIIPGLEEVLRVNGRATIIKNEDILSSMSLKEKPPQIGIGVDVEECFIHCTRALKESDVWKPDMWPNKEDSPTMMEVFEAHLNINSLKLKE